MLKVLLILFSIASFSTSIAYAESSANVEIYNNVNSSSNSNSTATSRTDITVETNGKVTHYESNEPGSVSVKSVNGESEIKVNGVSVSNSPINPSINPTGKDDISKEPTPSHMLTKEVKNIEEKQNQIENLVDEIKEKIDEIGNIISSLFD